VLGEDRASIREVVEFPRDLIPPVPLLLAMPKDATNAAEAKRFIAFARSDEAKAILLKHRVGAAGTP
jgi:ABC-type molybdate transport system substrate-binding protein